MAILDFEDRVLLEIGSYPTAPGGGSISDNDFKNQVFEDASRESIAELPKSAWEGVATVFNDGGSGLAVVNSIILDAWKGSYNARKISTQEALNTSNTFLSTDPVWYEHGGNVYVLPSGGSVKLITGFLATKDTTDFGESELLNKLVILKAATHFMKYKIREAREDIDDEITLPTTPTIPSAPSFTYSDASASSISTPTITAFGTAPVYTSPTLTESYTNFDTYFDLEDSEVGELALSKIRNQQDRLRIDIQDALNAFNDSNVEYQATIQKNIREAEFAMRANEGNAKLITDVSIQNEVQTIQAAIQQYVQELSRHAQEIQSYSAQVRALVSQWEISLKKADAEIRQLHFDRDRIIKDYNMVRESLIKTYSGMPKIKVKFHEF